MGTPPTTIINMLSPHMFLTSTQVVIIFLMIQKNTMRSFISTQKDLNKEFIAKFERFDALNEKVDNLTRELVTAKNHMSMKKLLNMCKT
jgi:hypothetical protein